MVLARNAPRDISRKERRSRNNPTWQADWNVTTQSDKKNPIASGRDAVVRKIPGKRFAKVEPVRELTWEERLRADSEQALNTFHQRLGKSDIFAENDPLQAQRAIEDEHHRYAMGMIKAALKPIRDRSADQSRTNAVMKSIGMGVGMWLVSPGFCKEVCDLPKNTLNAMDEHVRDRVKMKVEAKSAQGKRVGTFLQRRYDRVMQAEEGGHAPFSEYSAAVTVMGISDAYYDKMREPDADREMLTKRFEENIQHVYDKASRDGVDPVQVDANMRYLVGQRMNKDPSYAARYAHTGYGDLVRTDPVVLTREDEHGNTVQTMRWDGQFKHHSGAVVTTSDPGYFVPRLPTDAQEHTTHMSQEIGRDLGSAKDAADLQRKLFAWTGALHDSFEDYAEKNASAGKPYEKNVMTTLDRMATVMSDDGLDESAAHLAYSNAFTHAFSELGNTNPELTQSWIKEYGADWDVRLGVMLNDMEHGELYVADAVSSHKPSMFQKDREQGVAGKTDEPQVVETRSDAPEHESSDPFARVVSSSADLDDEFDPDAPDDAADMFGAQDMSKAAAKAVPITPAAKQAVAQAAREQAQVHHEAEAEAETMQFDADERDTSARPSKPARSANRTVQGKSGLMAQAVRNQAAAKTKAAKAGASKDEVSTAEAARTTGVVGLGRVEVAPLSPAQKAAAARRAARTAKARRSTPVAVQRVTEAAARTSKNEPAKDSGPSI